LAAWTWGEFVQRSPKHKGLAIAVSLAIVASAYFFVLEKQLSWRSPVVVAKAGGSSRSHPGGIDWQDWSRKAVEEARAAGRPVLVDFTADWCLSCQVNKKTSLEIPSVQTKLKEIGAVPLLGDTLLCSHGVTQ
jgi:thiol:disulfide interchange protein DsbD